MKMSLRFSKGKCSSHEDSTNICLLINDYNMIVEDFLQILNTVCKHTVYPESRNLRYHLYRKDFFNDHDDNFMIEYEKHVRPSIKASKVIIAVVTNEFINSGKCAEMLKYTRKLKKPIIGLIVDELDNYSDLKTTLLKGFEYYCDIYEDRVNQVGYDQYLWISDSFYQLARHIGTKLSKKFVRNIN